MTLLQNHFPFEFNLRKTFGQNDWNRFFLLHFYSFHYMQEIKHVKSGKFYFLHELQS